VPASTIYPTGKMFAVDQLACSWIHYRTDVYTSTQLHLDSFTACQRFPKTSL